MAFHIREDRPRLFIELRDGTEAMLSPLDPEDKPLLADGLEHLSVESRYNRFGQGVGQLSHRELEYLTNVDQRDHVAWGAIVAGRAAGVGRYIVLRDGKCAEIAVTVIDELQGRGLGTVLFRALTAVARADGLERFCFELVPDNAAVQRMLRGVDVRYDDSGGLLEGELRIFEIPAGPHDTEMVEAINQVRRRGSES